MERELERLKKEIQAAELNLQLLKKQASKYDPSILENAVAGVVFSDPHDINDYKAKLKEKDELIQQTEQFSKVGRWSYSFETLEMTWSKETFKLFECPEDYTGSVVEFYLSCVDESTANRLNEKGQEMRVSREKMNMTQFITTAKGNSRFLSFSSIPIYDEHGNVIGAEGLVKDFSDHITGEKGVQNFFNLSSDLHCIVHMDRSFVKVSPAWTKLLGYTENELLSRSFLDFVHPDDLKISKITGKELDDQGLMTSFENRYLTKSGEVVYLSWNSQLDPETQLAFCTARDITKSKLEQDELLSDLSGKDLLLREIHHRVKNNLQIISSLLSLQSGANSHEEQLTKLYEDSRNRIKSMATIHEMFYQSEQLDKIEFGKYLDKLIGDLSKSITSHQKSIDLILNIDPVYVNLDTAIPLGLLINEIVTNSIKHGADESGQVKISIELETLENGQLEMIIGDSGSNGPKDILNQKGESLGIMLINSLVEQIDGEIIQLNELPGTVYKLIFTDRL
ncbi:MAG TPA: histidine kinase dimerization/phosphoacceptor domain -containing protein [Brumimicrobium sp.]|nr:histidine kinase dimerization/phosphoacceptor domain -containing protein [Brumimicrobium sp.]